MISIWRTRAGGDQDGSLPGLMGPTYQSPGDDWQWRPSDGRLGGDRRIRNLPAEAYARSTALDRTENRHAVQPFGRHHSRRKPTARRERNGAQMVFG